jgi:dolichol kinase
VSAQLELSIAMILLVLLAAAMLAARLLGQKFSWSAELQRKFVHLVSGSIALSFPFVFFSVWPVIGLTLAASTLLLLSRQNGVAGTLGMALHQAGRHSWGEFLFPASTALLFYAARGNPMLFVLPMAVETFADAAAALVGTKYGRRRFAVGEGYKSLEGVFAFVFVAWVAAFIVLLAMTGLDLGRAALLSFSAAIIGAGIEAVCVRGFDNLFVPLGLFVFVIEQMNALTSHLAILATVLLIASCSVVFLVFARQRTFTSVAGVAILLFAV